VNHHHHYTTTPKMVEMELSRSEYPALVVRTELARLSRGGRQDALPPVLPRLQFWLTVILLQQSIPATPAVKLLRDRLQKGQALNNEIADWLQVLGLEEEDTAHVRLTV
jgi:hypothetical protein